MNAAYVFRGVALPDNLKESIDAFVETGRPMGHFLTACVNNDLREAVGRADEASLPALSALIGYLYNECDARCWGHAKAAEEWIEAKRLERQEYLERHVEAVHNGRQE